MVSYCAAVAAVRGEDAQVGLQGVETETLDSRRRSDESADPIPFLAGWHWSGTPTIMIYL